MKKIAGSGFLVQQKNWCNYFYSIVHSIVLLIFIVHIIVCFHCRFHPQIPRKSQVPVGSPSRSCFRWIYLSNLATNLWQRAAWLARCWNLGGNWEDLAWWLEDDLYLCILIYIYHICVCVCWGRHAQMTAIYHEPIVEGHPKTTQWTRQKWSMDMLHMAKIDPWPKHLGMVARSNKRFVGRYPRF